MQKNLFILRGISGAGKSTFASLLSKVAFQTPVVASADHIHVGKDGVYRFDPSKLGEGHAACFRTAVEALQKNEPIVIVDNTNTQNWEMAPYVLAGSAYGYTTNIVRLVIAPNIAAERNVHGVPAKSVNAMHDRFQEPMRMWPSERFFENPTEEEVRRFWESVSAGNK